jgi:putative redox protein
MRSERFDFAGADGQKLAARLDLPDGTPAAYSLFAHCFTCSKDSLAASRIARTLAEQAGIATLRFDFTGLGSSEGEFANTGFSSNVADLLAAVSHMRARNAAPALLIGHSLGGAAVLAAASEVPEARAVVTISAPCNADHVTKLLGESRAEIETRGEATVLLGGRPFTIRRAFLEDVGSQDQAGRIARLNRALLVMHAPADATVGIENASAIYGKARHPKSFVSLDDADHLLTRPGDAEYAARVLAAWASRYVGAAAQEPVATMGEGEVLVESGAGRFGQRITAGRHRILADEPMALGGDDTGPSPYELLLAGLGACTAMTISSMRNGRVCRFGASACACDTTETTPRTAPNARTAYGVSS